MTDAPSILPFDDSGCFLAIGRPFPGNMAPKGAGK